MRSTARLRDEIVAGVLERVDQHCLLYLFVDAR